MNEEFWRWYMYGHWVCLTQWLGFIMVEYAYLGKGKVKHPLVWSGVITMLTMTLSVVHNYGFLRRWQWLSHFLFLFITVMLFGGTPGQKVYRLPDQRYHVPVGRKQYAVCHIVDPEV